MPRTLQQILIDSNAYLDLSAALPTGDELTTRTNYANQAVLEAAAFGQLSELHRIYNVDPSTLASISLPNGFMELTNPPMQANSSGTYDPFVQIHPADRFNRTTDEKYCYVLGNPAEGYTAVFNGLTAHATLSIDYQRAPTGLVTLTDVCELPDPQYVVTRINSFVLESRNNDRFPIVKADSNTKLQNMFGREMKTPGGGTNSTAKTGASNYRIGV